VAGHFVGRQQLNHGKRHRERNDDPGLEHGDARRTGEQSPAVIYRQQLKEEVDQKEKVEIQRQLRIAGKDRMPEDERRQEYPEPFLAREGVSEAEQDQRVPGHHRDDLLVDGMHDHEPGEHVCGSGEERGKVAEAE
jgi:hypothetical protein